MCSCLFSALFVRNVECSDRVGSPFLHSAVLAQFVLAVVLSSPDIGHGVILDIALHDLSFHLQAIHKDEM